VDGKELEIAPQKQYYNSPYGALPTPTREGYTFAGWSLLPIGYTQVEYIESSGTQVIDTGVQGNNSNLGFEVKYSWVTLPSSNSYAAIFGSYKNESSVTTRLLQFGPNTTYYNINSKAYGSPSMSVTRTVDTIYSEKITSTPGGMTYKSNNLTSSSSSTIGTDINNTIYLFSHGSVDAARSSIKLYEFIIYDNEKVAHNYIPCINNTTGKAGLYDLVSGTFLENSGTGDFAYGSETNTYISDSSLITNNHTITAIWEAN